FGEVEDLAGVVPKLAVLVGLTGAIVEEAAGERNDVECDRAHVHVRVGEGDRRAVGDERRRVLRERGAHLRVELLHPGESGAGDRLVGGDDEPGQPRLVVERLEHGHRGHRRAVGVRNDPLRRVVQRPRVHFGDDEGNLVVPAPCGGVVDDRHPSLGEPGCLRPRGCPAGGEQGDVEVGDVGGRGVLHRDLLTAEGKLLARRPGRGEEAHRGGREVPLLEQVPQDLPYLSGCSNNSNIHTHRPVPPYTTASTSEASSSNAEWTARTASSRSSLRTTTEIRISEVEIISMLIPASRSAPNSFAETPGWERIPAPTKESFPTFSLYTRSAKPSSSWMSASAVRAAAAWSSGRVRDTSVSPVSTAETFCTIMSMLHPWAATTSKMRAAVPGRSGTPLTVTLPCERSWATPEMIGASMLPSSSSVTVVPGRLENDERTWS